MDAEVSARASLIALVLVILADGLLYRGSGGLGYALFMLASALLISSARAAQARVDTWLPLCLLLVLAGKTLWQCDAFTPWLGFVVLFLLAVRLAGFHLDVLGLAKSCLGSIMASLRVEIAFLRTLRRVRPLRHSRVD